MEEKLQLIKIGKLSKAKGLKGHVQGFVTPEFVERLKSVKLFYIQHLTSELPYFIEEFEIAPTGHSLFLFEGVDNRTKADALHGKEIFTEQKNLKKQKKYDNLDYLIGYQVMDEKLGFIGLVDEVFDMPSHPIVQVFYNDKPVMIPLVNEYNLIINERKKSISLLMPDGMLEL